MWVDVVFWESAVDVDKGEVKDEFPCPGCRCVLEEARLGKEDDESVRSLFGERLCGMAFRFQVWINGRVDRQRLKSAQTQFDVGAGGTIRTGTDRRSAANRPNWLRTGSILPSLSALMGFTHVHHFYTERNLAVLVRALAKCPMLRFGTYNEGRIRISKRYGLT
jgi:hypothetical protein